MTKKMTSDLIMGYSHKPPKPPKGYQRGKRGGVFKLTKSGKRDYKN